jgi:uncharacterized protein YwqG
MKRTTPPPRKNVLEILPELASRAKTTIRLRPRKGKVAGLANSKMGGAILWPKDEPWPTCEEFGHYDVLTMNEPYPAGTVVPLLPVLQLRTDDFPEIEFFPGADLLQLLWCPLFHNSPPYLARSFWYWRKADDVKNPLRSMPKSEFAAKGYYPNQCRLLLERVVEYPWIDNLPARMRAKIDRWDIPGVLDEYIETPAIFYEWESSNCPGNKVGGYPHFIQREATPKCTCGRRMVHLLTLTDDEFDAGTHYRWCPIEDKRVWAEIRKKKRYDRRVEDIQQMTGFDGFGGGYLYYFVCRKCKQWPIRPVFQR